METVEKITERTMEMIRKTLDFLKKAKKRLREIRTIKTPVIVMRYFVGRMLRRKTLIIRIINDIAVMQARNLAIRLSLFLVVFGCLGIVLFSSVVSLDLMRVGFFGSFGTELSGSTSVGVLAGSSDSVEKDLRDWVRIGSTVVDSANFFSEAERLVAVFFVIVERLVIFFAEVDFLAVFFAEVECLVVFWFFFFTGSIVLLMLLL